MIHRVAHALLVVVLVLTGGSAPFAHVHARVLTADASAHGASGDAGTVHRHAAHQQGQGAHWHSRARHATGASDAATRVSDDTHPAAVSFPTVAEEPSSPHVGAPSALNTVWLTDVAPDPVGRSLPIAANARSNPRSHIVLAARAPPF